MSQVQSVFQPLLVGFMSHGRFLNTHEHLEQSQMVDTCELLTLKNYQMLNEVIVQKVNTSTNSQLVLRHVYS